MTVKIMNNRIVPHTAFGNVVTTSRTAGDVELWAKSRIARHCDSTNFAWSRAKSVKGKCVWRYKAGKLKYITLFLSKEFAVNPKTTFRDLRNTFYHELSHAMLPLGYGHNCVWAAQCQRFGVPAEIRFKEPFRDYAWKATCLTCGRKSVKGWYRKPKHARFFCKNCGCINLNTAIRNKPLF